MPNLRVELMRRVGPVDKETLEVAGQLAENDLASSQYTGNMSILVLQTYCHKRHNRSSCNRTKGADRHDDQIVPCRVAV